VISPSTNPIKPLIRRESRQGRHRRPDSSQSWRYCGELCASGQQRQDRAVALERTEVIAVALDAHQRDERIRAIHGK
jgi:hypothetical protein